MGVVSSVEDAKRPFTEEELKKLGMACEAESQKLLEKIAEKRDTPTKWKTALGAITGGIGVIGGAGTAASASETGTVTQGTDTKINPDDASRTKVIGYTTAILTAIGTVLVITVSPGEEELKNWTVEHTKISTDLDGFLNLCGKTVDDGNYARCFTMLGGLQSLCKVAVASVK